MTARQPRRTRRRKAPADSLPRIRTDRDRQESPVEARTAERIAQREHHVTSDYRYVWREMAIIAIVSAITFGFVFAMWLIV